MKEHHTEVVWIVQLSWQCPFRNGNLLVLPNSLLASSITMARVHKDGILKWQRFSSFLWRSCAKIRRHHFLLTDGFHADTLCKARGGHFFFLLAIYPQVLLLPFGEGLAGLLLLFQATPGMAVVVTFGIGAPISTLSRLCPYSHPQLLSLWRP